MAIKWGLFLCNCRGALALDLQKLVLPIAPSVLSTVSDPGAAVGEFAGAVTRERPDRVLIACCAAPDFFSKALDATHAQSPKLHFVDLKESCFLVHSDIQKAHAKATRLLRAAMAAAEANETPAYNTLNVGGRVVIAAGARESKQLAEDLRDFARPIFVTPPEDRLASDGKEPAQLHNGRVVAI
jgi:heterodisulfide reductase subunit A-like polyferredoxin